MIKRNPLSLALAMLGALSTLGIARAADELPRKMPLQNPGFETGLGGWDVGESVQEQVSVEKQLVHGGAQAVKMDATQKRNMPFIAQKASGLIGASTYQFSVWARTAPGAPAARAAIKMENYNAAGKNTSGPYGTLTLPDDGAWKQVTLTFQVDPDTTISRLLLRVMNASAVIFDDATFLLVKYPADVTIVSPMQRTFQPDEPRTVTYEVYLRRPWKEAPPPFKALVRPLELMSDAGATQTLSTSVLPGADKQHVQVTVALPVDQRDYVVNLGYERDGQFVQSEAPAYLFTPIVLAERKPHNLTENGTILHGGKPFFPIGIYHPGVGDYQLLAENGFNAVQGAAPNDLGQFKAGLDAAQKYGLAVDVPLYGGLQVAKNLQYSLEKLRHFADHPAILDWKIIDEPELRPEISHEVPPVYRALKAVDDKNPIELTISGAGSLDYWGDFCDIVQVDVYPFPHSPLTQVSDKAREAKKAMQSWQNLSFVVQCGWMKDLSNQPSAAQARSMVYLALIEGARGIWWYSMREASGWDLTKTPLWPHMKTINAEIQALSEPLMLGTVATGVSCDQAGVLFRAMEYQGETYLLVTNPENKPVQATFTLPKNLRSWRPLASDASRALANRQLRVSLQGFDSRTFVLKR